jgi:hypothetical protein
MRERRALGLIIRQPAFPVKAERRESFSGCAGCGALERLRALQQIAKILLQSRALALSWSLL